MSLGRGRRESPGKSKKDMNVRAEGLCYIAVILSGAWCVASLVYRRVSPSWETL